jgi:hypothetical protein
MDLEYLLNSQKKQLLTIDKIEISPYILFLTYQVL